MAKTKPQSGPWAVETVTKFAPDERSIPAAREVLKKGGFGKVEATADGRGWWVTCRGITGDYQVSVRQDPGDEAGFDCECTCPSPKYPCKHALALLLYLVDHPELRVEKEETGRAPGDFEPLLRAVFQNPDDDTPRLIFADYLEEFGQADRAALIRVQCEKERTRKGTNRFKELEKAEKPLRDRLNAAIRPFPEGFDGRFRRGFLRLTVSLFWLEDVNALPDRFVRLFRDGWVEAVAVHTYGRVNPAACELLRFVGELDFTGSQLDEAGLATVVAETVGRDDSRVARVKVRTQDERLYKTLVAAQAEGTAPDLPLLRGRSRTHQAYHGATAGQLDLLARAGRLDGARSLFVDGPIGDEGARLLAETDGLAGLTDLTLSNCGIGPAGAEALAGSAHLAGLERLSLHDGAISEEGFGELCRRGAFPRLDRLQVVSGGLGDTAARALAAARHFSRLSSVNWQASSVTSAGVGAILRSSHLPELNQAEFESPGLAPEMWLPLVLDAADRPSLAVMFAGAAVGRTISRAGVDVRVTQVGGHPAAGLFAGLPACAGAKRVTGFALTGFGFTTGSALDAATVGPLAAGLSPDRLKELDLSADGLGNGGAAAVAEAFRDFRPQVLNLARNNIRKAGAMALAASPLLASVKVLDLSHNRLGFNGVNAIASSPHLGKLKELRLQGTGLTPKEWKEVEKKVGKGVVV